MNSPYIISLFFFVFITGISGFFWKKLEMQFRDGLNGGSAVWFGSSRDHHRN